MEKTWILYTVLTVAYIIVLVIYFIRRSKTHEKELSNFLKIAQDQLETHKQQAAQEANQKVVKAMSVVKKVQLAAQTFEEQAQSEYEQIIDDAKAERREILAQAKSEIEELFQKTDRELDEYKAARYREIEKNLVKLVISVTQKVVGTVLTPKDHQDIIDKALEEVKKSQSRT